MAVTLVGNPNYSAFILTITETKPLEGLDNLVAVNVAGYQALVGKDTQAGDRFVAFVAGTRLSPEYAAALNLYRNNTLNTDPAQAGYLEENRRVRALRLRGHASNALLVPIKNFSTLGGVADGEQFDTIDGVLLCEKYVVPVKPNSSGSGVGAFQKPNAPTVYFPEHYNTPQWGRVSADFVGKDVTVTQKLHGCFSAKATVLMWDGTQSKITRIKKGDLLVGLNAEGNAVPSKAKRDAFTTGSTDEWTRIQFEQPVQGDKPTIHCTGDHRILTSEGYVEAKELRVGDTAFYTKSQPKVTPDKTSVIAGLMLGDGSIAGQKRNSIEWGHKVEHSAYVEHKARLLGNLNGKGKLQRRMSGYGTEMVCARTQALETVRRATSKWASGIPVDFKLDPQTLAIWYMDDGSLAHHESQQDRANFATCNFTDQDVTIMGQALDDYGFLNYTFYKSSNSRDKDYWRLRLNKDDAEVLFNDIRHLVPEVMQYKLPVYHRGYFEEPVVVDEVENVVFESKVIETSTVTAEEYQHSTKWDIETETSNFVANRMVVHNSSIRLGWTDIWRDLNWFERLVDRLGVRVDRVQYKFAVGSRKVLKSLDFNTKSGAHFYVAGDIWTEYARKHKLQNAIPHNFTVYGELIGWTPDGKPIQKGYTYDLPAGQMELYVYRVAFHSDDLQYDLSDAAMREFCAMRGIKVVPLLFSYSKDDVAEGYLDNFLEGITDENLAEVLTTADEAPVPLSADSPCDEGVVIRAEGVKPHVAKYKFPLFYEHETKAQDKGEEDIEEQ